MGQRRGRPTQTFCHSLGSCCRTKSGRCISHDPTVTGSLIIDRADLLGYLQHVSYSGGIIKPRTESHLEYKAPPLYPALRYLAPVAHAVMARQVIIIEGVAQIRVNALRELMRSLSRGYHNNRSDMPKLATPLSSSLSLFSLQRMNLNSASRASFS